MGKIISFPRFEKFLKSSEGGRENVNFGDLLSSLATWSGAERSVFGILLDRGRSDRRKKGRKEKPVNAGREREREGEEFRWKLGGTEREKAASHLDRRSAGLGERKREREARRGVLIHQLRVLPPSTPALCPSCRPPLADSLAPFHFASLPSLFPSFVPPQRRERSIRDRHRPPAPTSQLPSSSFPP